MSPATRWSASARWSWWATSSRRRATETIVPMALATTEATSPSRDPSAPVVVPDEVEHAPRSAERRDDDCEFGSFAREDRERRPQPLGTGQGQPAALLGRIVGERGGGERGAEHAERAWPFDEPLWCGVLGASHGPGEQAVVAQLPDRDEVVVVGVANESDRPGEVVVEVVGLGRQAGDRIDEREIDRMPLRGERVGGLSSGGVG